jgi:hypothetical protein
MTSGSRWHHTGCPREDSEPGAVRPLTQVDEIVPRRDEVRARHTSRTLAERTKLTRAVTPARAMDGLVHGPLGKMRLDRDGDEVPARRETLATVEVAFGAARSAPDVIDQTRPGRATRVFRRDADLTLGKPGEAREVIVFRDAGIPDVPHGPRPVTRAGRKDVANRRLPARAEQQSAQEQHATGQLPNRARW